MGVTRSIKRDRHQRGIVALPRELRMASSLVGIHARRLGHRKPRGSCSCRDLNFDAGNFRNGRKGQLARGHDTPKARDGSTQRRKLRTDTYLIETSTFNPGAEPQ
jgi:hypothetical protein